MKLAEALILRADCQKRIEQLRQRLLRNVKVQEGDKPAEEPMELIQVSKEHRELDAKIQGANWLTELIE